jgi:hypothetical protein
MLTRLIEWLPTAQAGINANVTVNLAQSAMGTYPQASKCRGR